MSMFRQVARAYLVNRILRGSRHRRPTRRRYPESPYARSPHSYGRRRGRSGFRPIPLLLQANARRLARDRIWVLPADSARCRRRARARSLAARSPIAGASRGSLPPVATLPLLPQCDSEAPQPSALRRAIEIIGCRRASAAGNVVVRWQRRRPAALGGCAFGAPNLGWFADLVAAVEDA
jgi:hypothetical protein